jgi:hypothetical protein
VTLPHLWLRLARDSYQIYYTIAVVFANALNAIDVGVKHAHLKGSSLAAVASAATSLS